MLDTRFLYLKNNLILFLFIIITGASCTPETLWDIPVETIKTQLYISDYSFLDTIDFTDRKPSDALVLGRGAPYYFSLILAKKKNSEFEQKMLSESWASGEKLWKEESGLMILKRLLDEEKYELLEKNALRFLNDMKYGENAEAVKKIYIEALYWLKKDEEVVKALDLYFPGGSVSPGTAGSSADSTHNPAADPELLLFRSVALCRSKQQGWQEAFIKLFLEFDTDPVHQRAYNFLVIDENTYKSFDESMQRFFIVKNLLSIGKISLALPIIETYLNSIDKTIIEKSSIIAEMGLAYLANDELTRGLSFLTTMSQKLSGSAKLDAIEMAGRIARKKKDYPKAAQLFETALKEIVEPLRIDRVAWFRLASLLEISSDRFIDELLLYAQKWSDPVYFDDIIRKAIGVLVMEKKWKQIERLYSSLPQSASAETRTQLLFLHTRLLMTNLITGKKETVDQEIANNLNLIASGNDNDYYTFLASSFLKIDPPFIKNIDPGTGDKKSSENKPITAEEKFVSGFFDFGLMEEGYDAAYRFRDIISPQVILAVAVRLNQGGYIKHSIWLLNTLFSLKDHTLTKKELMFAYPLAYDSYIRKNAEEWEFDASFFYALIREESAFDTQNTSVTGASGLSQLMPDTAKEVAGWLKLKNYDLSDPETNLAIGSYYYARLQKKLQSIPKTLIAYNAGQGNLRSWEKEFGSAGNLPPDLFIEAIPFRETREYVKKIIVTACLYAWLYQQRTCDKTMAAAYPELLSPVQ